jgi:hypothetical protein
MQNEIAQTIVKQLGNGTLAMLGAKDLVAFENGLQFRIGRNPMKVAKLAIYLRADDTYAVRAYRKERGFYVDGGDAAGVYVDSLHATIEDMTGLRTRL